MHAFSPRPFSIDNEDTMVLAVETARGGPITVPLARMQLASTAREVEVYRQAARTVGEVVTPPTLSAGFYYIRDLDSTVSVLPAAGVPGGPDGGPAQRSGQLIIAVTDSGRVGSQVYAANQVFSVLGTAAIEVRLDLDAEDATGTWGFQLMQTGETGSSQLVWVSSTTTKPVWTTTLGQPPAEATSAPVIVFSSLPVGIHIFYRSVQTFDGITVFTKLVLQAYDKKVPLAVLSREAQRLQLVDVPGITKGASTRPYGSYCRA